MRRTRLLILALLVCAAPGRLAAQQFEAENASSTLQLEWSKVAGAGGYMVEIQDGTGQTRLRQETTETTLKFGLPVGEYRQRIGVLNKFKKVSVWSNWRPLIIRRPGDPVITSINPPRVALGRDGQAFEILGENIYQGSKISIIRNGALVPFKLVAARPGALRLSLNTTSVAAGTYSVIIDNPGGRQTRSSQDLNVVRSGKDGQLLADTPRWKKLVPGWYQYSSGETIKGALWFTTFAGLAVAGAATTGIANNAAAATASDPLYQLMFNPLWLYAVRDSFSTRQQGLMLAAAAYDRVIDNRYTYENARQAQGIIGGAAVALYVLNYVDASDWDFGTAVPGAKTPAWRGTLYWTLLGGLAAAGASEFSAAEASANTAASDPLVQSFASPLLTTVTLGQTRNEQTLLLASLAATRGDTYEKDYARHQQNQAIIGVGAALVYFGHFLDLSFSDAGLAFDLQYVPEGLVADHGGRSEGFTGVTLHFSY